MVDWTVLGSWNSFLLCKVHTDPFLPDHSALRGSKLKDFAEVSEIGGTRHTCPPEQRKRVVQSRNR